jgi:hypothetical protein
MKAKLDNYFKAFHDNKSTLSAKDLLIDKAKNVLNKYVPLFIKENALLEFQEWSNNMLKTMGIDPDEIDVEEVFDKYVASTAPNPAKLDYKITKLKNELNNISIYNDHNKVKQDVISDIVRSTPRTAFTTSSKSSGDIYVERSKFLNNVKNELNESFDKIVKPYALATALDSIYNDTNNLETEIDKNLEIPTIYVSNKMFKSEDFKNITGILEDNVDSDKNTVVQPVSTELPKEEPKAELSMSSPAAMFNKDLTKPYSPNLSMHYDVLMNEDANKHNDLYISTPDSTVDIPVSIDDIPDSNKVDSATYIKNMQDYLENLKDRKKVIQDILTNNNIITEDELNEITGVDKIIAGMNKAFIALNNKKITNLSKAATDEIQKQMQYVKDVITKYGSRLQSKYKLEAKLKSADDKVEALMQELKRNNNIEYLLKLPTNVYEMLPSEVKLACDQYMRKQIELTNAIKARKNIISKKALTQQIEPSKIQYVINPMLKRGYQVFI